MELLGIHNLSLAYGKQLILNDVSFNIPKGKIIGLLGPNGAGKSSILKILAGLVHPDNGKVTIKGKDSITFKEIKSITGFHIDAPSFYPYLSALDNLKIITKINKLKVDESALLDVVGLSGVGKKKVRHFSTGMKQRLAIAQALIRNPELLVLDEPFNGLDPNGFEDLITLIKRLNDKGITIVVSSHLLNELEQLAHQFILINEGQIELNVAKEVLKTSISKLTLTSGSKITEKIKQLLENYQPDYIDSSSITIQINHLDVSSLVEQLVDNNFIPTGITSQNVLQQKYIELTQ